MEQKSRMYANTATWNPFRGCEFDCTYCGPSFKRQAKRRKQSCMDCYDYVPHYHYLIPQRSANEKTRWVPRNSKNSPCGVEEEWRLPSIPSAETIFVCGFGDISLCDHEFISEIIKAIRKHSMRRPNKTYYFQSKKPACFEKFLSEFPINVYLLTTLETNRDHEYDIVSSAPLPSERYRQFLNLSYPRKVLTIEPVMDFDVDTFSQWIVDLAPEYVWLGFNSSPNKVQLSEPSADKLHEFVARLIGAGVKVRPKDLRGIDLGIPDFECG